MFCTGGLYKGKVQISKASKKKICDFYAENFLTKSIDSQKMKVPVVLKKFFILMSFDIVQIFYMIFVCTVCSAILIMAESKTQPCVIACIFSLKTVDVSSSTYFKGKLTF